VAVVAAEVDGRCGPEAIVTNEHSCSVLVELMDGVVLMFNLLQHSVVFYIVALLLVEPRDGVVLTFLVLPDSVVLDLV
jgi:hypothetical protein